MAILQFIDFITTERRYSKHTAKAYQSDLKQFSSYIEDHFELKDPLKVNQSMVKSWTIQLKTDNIDNRSINRKLTTLRSFYRYCLKNEFISQTPLTRIKSLKTKKRLPVFVPLSDLEKKTDTFDPSFEGVRNKLIIELFYQTGMRLSELTQLKDSDIDMHANTIKVKGKRNKERIIPINDILKFEILSYIRIRNKEMELKTDSLFNTNKGKAAYPEMINRIVHAKLNEITTISKTSPHVLRHTFATHLLGNGANLMAIKELLGHTSLSATQIYTHNSIEQLKKIHQQAHPKG